MKIIQVNIEHGTHLDKIGAFIARENPDVVCMQEVLEPNFFEFKEKFQMNGIFVPMFVRNGALQGIATLSKSEILKSEAAYYHKPKEELMRIKDKSEFILEDNHHLILQTQIRDNKQSFTILNTHFPVHYPGHEVSDFQKQCFKKLDTILDTKTDFILMGDTNCPRGTIIFDTLARKYKDNIPKEAVTSLDPNLHRAGFLPYMVDCLFTTPEYKVKSIKLVEGVSDHMGIVAEIEKVL